MARAVRLLGGSARAFVAVGGYRGEQLCDLLRVEGVPLVAFAVGGETRVSLAVTDRSNAQQFRFVMPGPIWDDGLAEAALAAIGAELAEGSLLVLSGSQPSGVPVGFPARLAAMAKAGGARLVLDTSGAALEAVVAGAFGVEVLRLDRAESEALAGHVLPDVSEVAGFAADLVRRGVARIVVLAMGAEGSVLASADGCWHASTPPVPVISKVGAGDSFVGAFVMALAAGDAPEAALKCGVAAASAAVMSDATRLCRAADYRELCGRVEMRAVPLG